MKESADKKLKEHIIEVFDRYDDGNAELGWQKLRERHPGRTRRPITAWWSSIAAALMLGTFLYLNNTEPDKQEYRAKVSRNKPADQLKNDEVVKTVETDHPVDSRNDIEESSVPAMVYPHKKSLYTGNSNSEIQPKGADESLAIPSDSPTAVETQEPVAMNNEGARVIPFHANQILPQDSIIRLSTDVPLTASNLIADITSARNTETAFSKETTPVKTTKQHRGKLQLGFYAGPFFNYAQGSGNTMNIGAGVTSDMALNKRLTLITGVAVAKNTLVFRDELPATSYKAFAASNSQSALLAPGAPQISQMDALLFNLDVPLNIKYSLSRNPNKVFVTAGLSSYTYLSEAYQYSYSYNSFNNGTNIQVARKEVLNRNFGKFDLAQTLNLSFGLTHIAKYQDLVIEPFLKYPLGDLGSQNLRFGAAGLNLKLNIKPGNK